jgi:hypothetical protein
MDDESCRVIAGPFAIGVQLFLVRGQGGGESKAWFPWGDLWDFCVLLIQLRTTLW